MQKIWVFKEAALMSAFSTHCKLLTETVSVSDIVIGEGTFDRVKVRHLNTLYLQFVAKEKKEKLYIQLAFEATVLQDLQPVNFLHLCWLLVMIG